MLYIMSEKNAYLNEAVNEVDEINGKMDERNIASFFCVKQVLQSPIALISILYNMRYVNITIDICVLSSISF